MAGFDDDGFDSRLPLQLDGGGKPSRASANDDRCALFHDDHPSPQFRAVPQIL
jgi:hypothetical protein